MRAFATTCTGLVVFVLLQSGNAAFAQPKKDADLLAKIKQLEKRITELELAITELRASAKEDPRTEVEKKLVGTWMVSAEERKRAKMLQEKGKVTLIDLKFKSDGTCGVVIQSELAFLDAKYQVIGKQVVINWKDKNGSITWDFRIDSITETELVVDQDGRKVRYTRAK
jgi:hypothetical protein